MFKSKIIKATESDGGIIQHELLSERHGKPPVVKRYHSVRIGISNPAVSASGAVIVLGMPVTSGPGALAGGFNPFSDRLELLAEHQHSDLGLREFFWIIAEFSDIFLAEVTYIDFSDAAVYDPFRRFVSDRDNPLRFADVPYKNNPFASISMVKDRLRAGSLVLHGSEVKREASKLELEDIDDDLRRNFPLTAALAGCVAGFSANPPSKPLSRGPSFFVGVEGRASGWMLG